MTDGEIVASYRQAKNPKEQIKILAQLNNCDAQKIKDILAAAGAMEAAKSAVDYTRVAELYEQGLSDAKIAEEVFAAARTIANWRWRNKFPANGRKKNAEDVAADILGEIKMKKGLAAKTSEEVGGGVVDSVSETSLASETKVSAETPPTTETETPAETTSASEPGISAEMASVFKSEAPSEMLNSPPIPNTKGFGETVREDCELIDKLAEVLKTMRREDSKAVKRAYEAFVTVIVTEMMKRKQAVFESASNTGKTYETERAEAA